MKTWRYLSFAHFRTDVVRSPQNGVSTGSSGRQHLRDPEVPDLDQAVLGEEDVGRFQISVEVSLVGKKQNNGRYPITY